MERQVGTEGGCHRERCCCPWVRWDWCVPCSSCAHTAAHASVPCQILGPHGAHMSMTSQGFFMSCLCNAGAEEDPNCADSSPAPASRCWLHSIAPVSHHNPVLCRDPALCCGFGSQGLCPSGFVLTYFLTQAWLLWGAQEQRWELRGDSSAAAAILILKLFCDSEPLGF